MDIVNTIVTIGAVAAAVAAIWGVVFGITKWVQHQNGQSAEIRSLQEHHDKDIGELKQSEHERSTRVENELCILSYAVLAVLDGLKQQGCNGEVTKAHNDLEKYLNQKAHGQK